MLIKICKYCNNEYQVYRYEYDISNYCSRKCMYSHFKILRKGVKRNYVVSEETRLKMSLNSSKRGKKLSLEQRQAISNANKGKKTWNTGIKWDRNYKHSEEIKQKISRILKERVPKGDKHFRWKGGYENTLMLNKNRRINKRNNGGNHTFKQWKDMKEKHNFTCVICKKKEPEIILTRDHIIPLSKGGNNNIENIQPLCRSCNSRKFNKIIGVDIK